MTKNDFFGPSLKIKNQGPQAIEVYAHRFKRAAGGNGGIETVKEDQISNDSTGATYKRNSVALKLKGQMFNGRESEAFLSATNDGGNGIYNANDLTSPVEEGIKLLALGAGNTSEQTGTISLEGVAGKGPVSDGAKSDKFQLTLRIKKASN